MTTHDKSTPAPPALAPLVYWLVLVSGLALLTALRIDELDRMAPLWVGTVIGTAIGQLLARFRLRLWLVVFMVLNLVWILPLMALPLLLGSSRGDVHTEIVLMAFVPAAFSGYFSLSERGGLVAFWFPSAVWMISILDDADRKARDGLASGLLLGVLAVALVGWLLAREARRVALWQGDAPRRLALAGVRSPVVLREAPLRRVSRAAWVAALAASTFAVTAWIAPHLWQKEKLEGKTKVVPPAEAAAGQASGGQAGPAPGEPCCSEEDAPAPRSQVSEYLPFLHPHDETTYTPRYCVACLDGVPFRAGGASGATSPGPGAAADPPAPSEPRGPEGLTPSSAPHTAPALAPASPAGHPATPKVAVQPKPADPPPTPKAAPPAALPPPVPHVKATVSTGPTVVVAVVPVEISPLAWLLTLAIVGTALQITLRPLRRLLLLRHLGRPLWAETVDQRVSNLWQLALIGLRDAGWVVAPGEQPGELARRVGLAGMAGCAVVLERARHGVRVDAEDLAAMQSAAAEAYRAARGRIGWAARAVSWLRWPLV